MKAKLVPLPGERRARGWINCQKYIIDLACFNTYRHFSSMCKWYILCVNGNFVEKWVLKVVNWTYILLQNNYLGNIFVKVITIKTLFALAIANCQGEFRGLQVVWGLDWLRFHLGSGPEYMSVIVLKFGETEFSSIIPNLLNIYLRESSFLDFWKSHQCYCFYEGWGGVSGWKLLPCKSSFSC